jgi:nitroreductase
MLDLLRRRRSVRKFTSEKLSQEHIDALTEAALRSPSSRGISPWKFILVDDPQILAGLATSKVHGAEFLKGAPFAIVVCADSSASDVWIEDCSIAAIIIQMMALSLGLGSCWAQIRCRQHDKDLTAESYIRNLIGLPPQIMVECVVGIGHPAEQKRPVAFSALQTGKICINRWK